MAPHMVLEIKKQYCFHKSKKRWEPLGIENLLDLSPKCRERIDGLLYRILKPLELSYVTDPQGLLGSAQLEIGSQGLIFSYPQYSLGAYAEGPLPVLIPYKMLKSCLRIDNLRN